MNWPRLAALLFTFGTLGPAHSDPPLVDKTPRMCQIEQRYHMEFVGILHTGGIDLWVFSCADPDAMFQGYPVTVPSDATDHDVDVALVASSRCANFYDSQFKASPALEATPTPTPASYTFTMPRHPREVTR